MYFVFVTKTRHKSVSCGNSKIIRKEMSKIFSCGQFTHHSSKCNQVDKMLEVKGIKKKMMNFDYCEEGIFKEYIKQNIIMAVLEKANFHSVDICRLIKSQSCKNRSRRKTDSNFIFCQATNVTHEILRRRNMAHIIEFSLH